MFSEEDTKCFKKHLNLNGFEGHKQTLSRREMLFCAVWAYFLRFLPCFNRLQKKPKKLRSFRRFSDDQVRF